MIKLFKEYINENVNSIKGLNDKELRKYLKLPKECRIEIKKGEIKKQGKYKNFIKYIILDLPSSKKSDIIKKIRESKPDDHYSHAQPNFGKGVNWTVKF